jgi:FAD/FMN-containing dehydrogenase/Fe-S oxidoreductase
MDQERARIQEDLRGLITGEVRCDDVFVQLYASDASIYQITPLGVVLPRSADDVAACVQYAAENQIPVHARGAGTGLAGESLGPGLVIDFSRHMRRILEVGADTVRLQPGVVHERLNASLRAFGRQFGPDPAMASVTTMGSVVAIDAAGSHWLKYGSARSHVRSLQIVLADGHTLEVGCEIIDEVVRDGADLRKRELVTRLAELLRQHATLIAAHQPRCRQNRSGYHLAGVLRDGVLDLPKLLVGSEGTLALTTAITLATQLLPRHRGVALLFFERLEEAARAAAEIVSLGASACDLMDRRHLSLAREIDARYEAMIPAAAEALLLVECEADSVAECHGQVERIVDRIWHDRRLAFGARRASDPEDVDFLWKLARKVVPTLYRLKGQTRPLPFVEDMIVPPEALPGFLLELQNILKRLQVTASLFGHAGHGQLHVRPFLDVSNSADLEKMPLLADALYEAVFAVGGSISGEHGDGLSRTPYVRRQYGPLYDVFREVKRIFDPQNILNPGKVIGDVPDLMTLNLRPVGRQAPATVSTNGNGAPAGSPPELVPLQLDWTAGEIHQAARSCNGCGACRAQSSEVRMCPIFRFAPREEASPRAKANLVRGILTGQLDPSTLASDEFKAVTDLCVNCQMCRLECPAGVDIPRLMLEGKAAYVATNGMTFGDWMLARLDTLSSWGSFISPFANWAIANRQMRWLLEKTLGIAYGRKLPRYAARSFMRRAARKRLTRPTRRGGRKVLYFVDTYANYHDPQVAEAAVAVLQHNGVSVYVHPGQWSSGMPMLTLGAMDQAQRVAEHNVGLLAEAVRQGYQIVASEPSAALCLTREYPALLDDDDARLVAENSSEICSYLWKLHTTGKLQLDLRPVPATVAYHLPCHIAALEVGSPGESLLRLIPGLNVIRTEKGCSGMAGTFGLKRENFRSSIRAGWGLISALRASDLQAGTTECSSCKMQMEQGTRKPTIHPLKLLALAYGLMPEAATLLKTHSEEFTVT